MIAAALFAASPARGADEAGLRAYNLAVLLVYNKGCAKLPELVQLGVALEIKDLSDAVLERATRGPRPLSVRSSPNSLKK
jgi:hypothetical protein